VNDRTLTGSQCFAFRAVAPLRGADSKLPLLPVVSLRSTTG